MSELKTFKCDLGKKNYSQLNNKVAPFSTCNTTSMVMALDYMGYKLPDDIFPEFKQPEDKLTMLCYTDDDVKAKYKSIAPVMYRQWIEELNKIKDKNPELSLKDYKFVDSYPPNEVHEVLSFATNKFIGTEVTTFKAKSTIEEITKELTESKPVVVSVKFGNLNHVLTLTGVTIERIAENSWKPIKFFADDTFGRFDMVSKKYSTDSGNDSEFDANELQQCLKAIGSIYKYAHFFNYPVAVV